MNTDGIYSSLLRTAVLMAATAALTLGTAHGSRPLILAGLVLLAATAYAYLRLHRLMHRRSRLMLEAIRNRDYSFRLPAGGKASTKPQGKSLCCQPVCNGVFPGNSGKES